MSIALSAEGDLFVQQANGEGLRFKLDGQQFNPKFVERFRVGETQPGSGFDGSDRLLVPTDRGIRVFGASGRRLMASDPKRDLSQDPFTPALHIRRAADRL